MKTFSYVAVMGAIAITAACSDSGSSSSSGSSVSITGSTALPEQMSLVTAQDESEARSLSRAVFDTSSLPSDSDYATAKQNIYVWLDAVEPISFIDSLLCFTNQSQPLAMAGQGNYNSWNDASRCFDDKGGEGGDDGQGSGEQVQQFVTIVGNSSQASASDPLIYRGWVEDYAGQSGEGEGPTAIKIRGEVRKTPTDANPFGDFTLTYGLLPSITASEAQNEGMGEVISSETSGGGASFTLYQEDKFTDNSVEVECTTTASVDYNESTETGLARTGRECSVVGGAFQADFSAAFALAVNSGFVHMAKASSYANINSATYDNEVCLARDSFNNVVWNYSVYNKTDGSAVDINSGMQLKVDGNGSGDGSDADGFESWGHIGYWGSWREDGQSFSDGETVQQATFDDTVGAEFTVKVAPGRLVKNTINSVSLSTLGGVRFEAWVYEGDTYLFSSKPDLDGDTDTDAFFNVLLEVNSNNNGFDVVATKTWNGESETITELNSAVPLNLNANISIHMWSRQLGGGVNYISGSTAIRLFERSFVNGSETGTGEIFESASATLKCFDRCLDVNITAAEVGNSNQDAVYVGGSAQTDQDYTFAKSDLTLKVGADSVVLSGVTRDNLANSNFWNWGLDSGPMITSTQATAASVSDAQGLYAAIEAGTVTEFYNWETGLEHWQQQTILVNASNQVVAFDPPITIKYTHATENDRNGDASQNGKVFLLEYGGKGQLWGLPFEENNGRWGPVINLKDGTILGASDQYIIKANDVEQRMQSVAASNCTSLPLTAPSQSVPTGITGDVFGIGSMPDISDEPPAVIDGEVVE